MPDSSGSIVPLIRPAIDFAQQPFDVGFWKPLAKPAVEGREDADEGIGAVFQHRVRLVRGDAELALQKGDEFSTCDRISKHEDRLGIPFEKLAANFVSGVAVATAIACWL